MKQWFFSSSRKKSFILLEVIVAIVLLMLGTIGGFEIYNSMSKKTEVLQELKNKLIFSDRALCRLLELLHTQAIPWEDIAECRSFACVLDTDWQARFQFAPIGGEEDENQRQLHRMARITLLHEGKAIEIPNSFPLCVKKE